MRTRRAKTRAETAAAETHLRSSVATRDRSGCWTDGGFSDDGHGYPMIGRRMAGHLAMEADGRPRPGRLQQLHSCDNPPCWNPGHLRWGTQRENMAEKVARGRNKVPLGAQNGSARLTEELVAALRRRRADGEGVRALAREAGVSSGTMTAALNGHTWTHVPMPEPVEQ